MARLISFALLFVFACGGLLLANAIAGDEKPVEPQPQKAAEKESAPIALASDEEVEAALAEFKKNYKATGIPREDKIMHRDWAMQQIAPLQHADVIKALGKVTKSGDGDLRMLAMIYLGDQRALAHLAAKHIIAAMKKDKKNVVLLMTGLQSLSSLKYLGARKEIADMLKHRDYAVKKAAILAVGSIKDIRMLEAILRLIGLKIETEAAKEGNKQDEKSGGKEVVEEGYSWEGAEAVVDRGEADNSQENADAKAQAEAQIASNKAAAQAAAGSGGGIPGAGGTSGGGGGRGASARSPDELIPSILRTLKALTGEEFERPGTVKKWLHANRKAVDNNMKLLDQKEKDQKKAK